MKEPADHKDVEAFFSEEFSKELKREVDVSVQWVDYADIQERSPAYHKQQSDKNIGEIANSFCAVVAGFLCVNIREPGGKTVLVDGRHRMYGSERKGYTGWWCLLTHGLTIEEEARLFRYFDKRKKMSAGEMLRGLIYEKDQAALELQGAVHSSGYRFTFDGNRKGHPIGAVGALMTIVDQHGLKIIKRILHLLDRAFSAEKAALVSNVLRGLAIFLTHPEVKPSLDENHLTEKLRTTSPTRLVLEARIVAASTHCAVPYGLAEEIRKLYNRGLSKKAGIIHDFARDSTPGKTSEEFRKHRLESVDSGWLGDAPPRNRKAHAPVPEETCRLIFKELHRGKRNKDIEEHYEVSKRVIDRVRKQGIEDGWPTGREMRDTGA